MTTTMTDAPILDVKLHGAPVGTLTRLGRERALFAFRDEYLDDPDRPTLGLGFKDSLGEPISEFRPYGHRLMPFFSNLLPEGHLRTYLAEKAGIHPDREFLLIRALGRDLPGAVTVEPADDSAGGGAWPPDGDAPDGERAGEPGDGALHFSLAGVQLKFSAVREASGGLTVPASGAGGRWIVKLPAQGWRGVPENEFSMMTLARTAGIAVPAFDLMDVELIGNLPQGVAGLGKHAFVVERFDRAADGSAVHMEDFAQVFGVYADDKYGKASYRSIARVLAAETGDADIAEFIRRLTFNTLIGNGDMHLKNWSLIYRDKRGASLAPAYDLVSTIPYIPGDKAALNFSRTRDFTEYTFDELAHLAAKAGLPGKPVREAAEETVALFMERWPGEKANLPMSADVAGVIDAHLETLPIAGGRA